MRHVLVVDDYPGICPLIQQALESFAGCRVTAAETGDGALPLLDLDPPDLVILDALMPGMSGVELAAEASQRRIPTILMTGEEAASRELAASGWRHMQKPFRVDTLLAEVGAVLADAEQNLAMVRDSLQRLQKTADEHHQAFHRLRETLLQSRAAHERRATRDR